MRLLHDMFECVLLLSSYVIAYLIKILKLAQRKIKFYTLLILTSKNDLSTFFNSAKQI